MKKNDRESALIEDIRKLSELMDSRFELPFGFRIGWDAIIGLIPGVGDFFTTLISVFILFSSYRLGCPPSVLLRMALNIVIDNLFDAIPVFGNVFDIAWKSNTKNYELAIKYSKNPEEIVQGSRWLLFFVLLFCLVLIISVLTLTILLTKWIMNLLSSFSFGF